MNRPELKGRGFFSPRLNDHRFVLSYYWIFAYSVLCYPYYNKWMSLCIMERYISETWPPILMKLGMKFTHILMVVRGKFHLISPINKNFSLITTFCIEKFEVPWLIQTDIYIVTKSIITQKRLNFLQFFLLLW